MPRKKKTEEVIEVKEKVEEVTAAKPAAKGTRTAVKETVKVQFGADEFDLAAIKEAVKADYKAKVKEKVKTVEIYIKPEDKAAYYVVNSSFTDKVDL
ncbi:MAG: hypothetical protein II680_11820 [Clostridia bacterium]|nr:hypothetical protein [Clostridia bacterium]